MIIAPAAESDGTSIRVYVDETHQISAGCGTKHEGNFTSLNSHSFLHVNLMTTPPFLEANPTIENQGIKHV